MDTNEQINRLTWEVEERPVYANGMKLEGYKGLFRGNTSNLLSIQKTSYSPTTNGRFIEVAERLNEITGFPIKNFYEVDGGRKTLAFLECTEPIEVAGFEFKDYLMLGNSFDGSTSFFIGNSSIMVRCSNRFSKNFRQLQVMHTKYNDGRIDSLCRMFESFMIQRKLLFKKMESFEQIKVDDTIKKALIERLLKMDSEERLGTELSTRKSNIIAQINASIELECKT